MSELFPKVSMVKTGYDREQVEAFFAGVREAYERPHIDPNHLSPLEIRRVAFDLARGGYSTDAVDTALDRLEDAFAVRLREQFVNAHGQAAWQQDLARRAEVLYERLRRPPRERFSRPKGLFAKGYDAKQVDALMGRLIAFFDTGEPLTATDIRTATFVRRGKRRAYEEAQVDAYLARAVDVLLGVS